MSAPEAAKIPKNRPKDKDSLKDKDKDKKPRANSQKSQTDRLKTVVRRLPPNLPEDIFWQSVHQWVSEDTVTWKEYYQGKFKKR